MIVANQVGTNIGIATDENAVTVLWNDEQRDYPRMLKTKLARELVELIAERLSQSSA